MRRRTIDFQGIIDLDRQLVEQLEHYLHEKENRLAHQILHSIPFSEQADSPTLQDSGNLKLSEAVEGFAKEVRSAINERGRGDPEVVKKEINSALWSFTEVLEGCVVELFQQVKQVPINRWHLSISYVMQNIRDALSHRIEDLIWVVRRLEKPLQDYTQHFLGTKKSWSVFQESLIDKTLMKNLQKTEKYLNSRYAGFTHRYNEYMLLSSKAEECLEKMKSYPVLALLDVPDQNLYVDLFRLLKIIDIDHPASEVKAEAVKALKQLASIESVTRLMRIYMRELRDALFNTSLEWKSLNSESEHFADSLERLQIKLAEYQEEMGRLIHTMSRYRFFILKNNPNPYVRSRWGFTEWIVGPEPPQAKRLLNMVYDAEELNSQFTQFSDSLKRDLDVEERDERQAHHEIDNLLHEMGQPLISRSMMRKRVETLLEQLKACNEIGSPWIATVYYVEDVLSKAMRMDWKHQVLYEFPLFHQIYRFHRGISEHFEDPAHAFRIERFLQFFDKIGEWIKKEDVYSHVHEIELDVNDMKTYLQDFLASVQRIGKDQSQEPIFRETIYKYRQQLLEYRYLFGQFFLSILKSNTPESLQLRNQFLFVHQYFESVENLLSELTGEIKEKM